MVVPVAVDGAHGRTGQVAAVKEAPVTHTGEREREQERETERERESSEPPLTENHRAVLTGTLSESI